MTGHRGLRAALADFSPLHDSPLGVAHPYWARKPVNLIELIVGELTDAGDLVVDPFMGSGTTVFASLRQGRRVVGGDISALSHFLVGSTLDLISRRDVLLPELRRLADRHRELTLDWYTLGNDRYVERRRFDVEGEFREGQFQLKPTELVSKQFSGGRWSHRRVEVDATAGSVASAVVEPWTRSPIDFSAEMLEENSRIAIPAGATLADYFTLENRASINAYRRLAAESPLAAEHGAALLFPLSSGLAQLRLSDRKASSQWPFWRPRTGLTSRNPVPILAERLQRVEVMAEWGAAHLGLAGGWKSRAALFLGPAQELTPEIAGEADLVLTDPPYGDQVPYGEYAELWNKILGLEPSDLAGRAELIRTGAGHRADDSRDYLERLRSAVLANARLLRPGGRLVWFYQDQDLQCWRVIADAAREAGLQAEDVISVPKQRRSLKTVVSPNTTLDGDLIVVFRRSVTGHPIEHPPASLDHLSEIVRGGGEDYFARYARMIEFALLHDQLGLLAERFSTVKRALTGLG